MSEPTEREENGGNRATVALVSAQVRGLELLLTSGFKDVQRQLDSQHEDYRNLIPAVDSLRDRVLFLETRVTDGEKERVAMKDVANQDRDWRRSDLPLILIGCVSALSALLSLLVLLH